MRALHHKAFCPLSSDLRQERRGGQQTPDPEGLPAFFDQEPGLARALLQGIRRQQEFAGTGISVAILPPDCQNLPVSANPLAPPCSFGEDTQATLHFQGGSNQVVHRTRRRARIYDGSIFAKPIYVDTRAGRRQEF